MFFRVKKFSGHQICFLIASVLIICALSIYLSAPQIPRFLLEGFPKATWPAPGYFAQVSGQVGTHKTPGAGGAVFKPTPRLLKLFQESDGKALLVYHDDKLQLEHYAKGFGPELRFNSYSMVKSLIGILILKAVAEKKIASLTSPIGKFLPEIPDATLKQVTLRDFLEMRSGVVFETDDIKSASGIQEKDIENAIGNPFGPMARLHMLGLETVKPRLHVSQKARKSYSYQNINTALLGAVLEKVYGQPLPLLLTEKIWKPAGATSAKWRQYGKNKPVSAYCCLYARPRDWGKIALYIANNGTPGTPLLPKPLWRAFLGHDLNLPTLRKGHYGLHIRHNILDRSGEPLQGRFAYFMGRGGQVVYIMADKRFVVVRFGDKQQLLHSTLYASWKSINTDRKQELSAQHK